MKRNRFVSGLLAGAMLLTLTACGSSGSSDSPSGGDKPEVYECNIAAASTSGSIYQWAVALSAVVNNHSDTVVLNPVTTSGGVENVNLVTSGDCELGVTNAAVISSALNGTYGVHENQNLRLVYGMNPSYVVFITGGDAPYNTFSDLEGEKVSIFSEAVGVAQWQLLREGLGVEPREYFNPPLELGISDACEGISAGTCDAVLTSSTKGQSSITEMGAGPTGVSYVGFTDEELEKITTALPFYQKAEYQDYGVDKTVNAVACFSYLFCNEDLPEAVTYEIARCIDEYHDEFVAAYAVAADSTVENTLSYAFCDLAAGTEKYFAEKGYK